MWISFLELHPAVDRIRDVENPDYARGASDVPLADDSFGIYCGNAYNIITWITLSSMGQIPNGFVYVSLSAIHTWTKFGFGPFRTQKPNTLF